VTKKAEREAIKAALADPTIKAFVLVVGKLQQLPSDRARKRVMQFIADRVAEERGQ